MDASRAFLCIGKKSNRRYSRHVEYLYGMFHRLGGIFLK